MRHWANFTNLQRGLMGHSFFHSHQTIKLTPVHGKTYPPKKDVALVVYIFPPEVRKKETKNGSLGR